MQATLVALIELLVNLISIAILIRVVLSWVVEPYHSARQFIDRLTEPILRPFRSVLPPTGMFDFTPMIALIVVQLAGYLLINIIRSLF